jgi:hypothetical protein
MGEGMGVYQYRGVLRADSPSCTRLATSKSLLEDFIQDVAPGHAAALTQEELHERGVYPIFVPAYSPDLNPIEAVWNKMKDYIESRYPDLPCGKQCTYEQLREIVKEAWHYISPEVLGDLVDSMKDRCEAVINADGCDTKY